MKSKHSSPVIFCSLDLEYQLALSTKQATCKKVRMMKTKQQFCFLGKFKTTNEKETLHIWDFYGISWQNGNGKHIISFALDINYYTSENPIFEVIVVR